MTAKKYRLQPVLGAREQGKREAERQLAASRRLTTKSGPSSTNAALRIDSKTVCCPPAPATPDTTPAAAARKEPALTAPAGELPVPGGEVTLGGEGTGLPLRRVIVKPFLVAETETTNEQYREYLKESGRPAPSHWKNGEFPPGAALEPVEDIKKMPLEGKPGPGPLPKKIAFGRKLFPRTADNLCGSSTTVRKARGGGRRPKPGDLTL